MRNKPLFVSIPLLAATLFVSSAMLPAGSALAQSAPYNAATIQENTDILAGPSNTFYVVGQVPKGSTVQVIDMMAGWFKVAPPAGTLSVVAKSSIALSDDKKSGVVSAEKADVFALNPKAIAESSKKQGTLAKGTKVQIAGEEGAFYKITPPSEAYVYLKPGTVRRLDLINEKEPVAPSPVHGAKAPEQPKVVTVAAPATTEKKEPAAATTQPLPPEAQPLAPAPKPAPKPASKPAAAKPAPAQGDVGKGEPNGLPYAAADKKPAETHAKPAAAPAPAKTPAEAPAPAPVAAAAGPTPQTNPDDPALKALELKLEEIQQLPLEQQPLEALLKQYQALDVDKLSRRDSQIVKARVNPTSPSGLPRSIDIAKTLKETQSLKLDLPPSDKKPEPKTTTTTTQTTTTEAAKPATELLNGAPVKYDAVGTLLSSTVYDGTDAPRLFRLVDTANSRTIVYVQPGDNFEPRQVLGQVVGIVGQTTYNPGLGLRVITVDKIDIMQSVPATGR
jgi:uncharacterized protein YgiM (DUF1202 family)